MSAPEPFRLGVNYWPARSAMAFWRNWNEGEVSGDFARIKNAGMDSVRIFLTWEDFQPSPTVVDARMLQHLQNTLHQAHAAGLQIMPTLFTGHMSGANWFPTWALRSPSSPGGATASHARFRVVSRGKVVTGTPLNWYSDAQVLKAQAKLAGECASALAGHPALLAWDLGNENSNCVIPETKESARKWLRTIARALRDQDPETPVTTGLHMEDLEQDRHLGPAEAAEVCNFLTMHGYPGYASFTDGSTDDRLLPFLVELTRFLGGGKDVFFTEFGVPTLPRYPDSRGEKQAPVDGPELISENDAASYVRRGLRGLQEGGASGAMLWCHSDYSPSLFGSPPLDQAPHERSFGLFRSDGGAKPALDQVRSFARTSPSRSNSPRVPAAAFIDLEPGEYYKAPAEHLRRLFQRYCQQLGEPR